MTLLEKLLSCFKNTKTEAYPPVAQSKYISFLLGSRLGSLYKNSELSENKRNGYGWATTEIELFLNTPDSDWDIRYPLSSMDKYPFRKFISAKIKPEVFKVSIESLIQEYFPNEATFTSHLFKRLCAYAFFGTTEPNTLFTPYKHGTLTNYISWETREDDIRTSLLNHNLVFIYGRPASGKTLITKKILKDILPQSSDIFFLDIADTPFSDGLKKISFVDGVHDFETTISYLEEKTEHSCLVIKKPFLTKEDFEIIDNYLSKLRMKIIVLTQLLPFDITYPNVSVDNRLSENLRDIYIGSRGEMDLTNNELETLIEIVDNNPYVLSLVGKALKNEENLKKEPRLKKKFLDKNAWFWTWNTTVLPKAHGNYHVENPKSAQALPTLITHILDSYGDISKYSALAVWAKVPTTKQFLIKYGKISLEQINEALDRGILELSPENDESVFMPSLMADTIWHKKLASYSEYKDQITDFLRLLHVGNHIQIPYKQLYTVIRVILQRFHFQISELTYRKNPQKNPEFMEWNRLLIRLIHRLTDLGDYETANEFLPYLFHFLQEKKIKDAANADERLIRDMLTLKVTHSKNGITPNNINDCIEFFKIAQQNFTQNKLPAESLGLYFVILEIENLLNSMIHNESSHLVSFTNNNVFNPSKRSLFLLHQLEEYILLKSRCNIIDVSYYYYFFMYDSFKKLYSDFSYDDYNHSAEIHLKNLLSLKRVDYDLTVNAKCQHLLFKLLFLLKQNPLNAWLTAEFQKLKAEYNELANYLQGKLLPLEVLYSFSSSTHIVHQFRGTLDECTLCHVDKALLLFSKYGTNQLIFPGV